MNQANDQFVFLSQDGGDPADHLIDLFAGCGGSGGGLLDATMLMGRKVRGTFVNHWDRAIEIHAANHPEHRHLTEDLFLLDPTTVFPPDTHCSLLWASPSCTFFSVARGASCVNEQDRSHAHSVTDWVRHLRPEGVIVENVKELLQWGPVIQKREAESGELMWALNAKPLHTSFDPDYPKRRILPEDHVRRTGESEEDWCVRMLAEGYKPYEIPDKSRAGEYFDGWLEDMKGLGYDAEHRVLCSADYGDPTIRKRLFIQFVRIDSGKRIVWPEPYAGERGKNPERPLRWRTARDIIQWELKGDSVFARKKKLADNTFRRLAIGLVKYGLRDFLMRPVDVQYHRSGSKDLQEKEFLVSSAHGSSKEGDCRRRVHDPDAPLQTLTAKGERGVVRAKGEFLIPNFGERPTQTPRTHSVDEPVPTVTSHGAGGVVEAEAYVLPQHGGHKKDYVKGVDRPVSAITTTMRGEGLVEPSIVQLKGQSTAMSVDSPLTAQTSQQSHYLMEPKVEMIDHIRGTGVVASPDKPLRSPTAGGSHQALAEAFMFAIDQSGGERKNDGTYPLDSPVRTLVTKANQACIEMELEEVSERFLAACGEKGVDTSRAETFLGFLVDELKRKGHVDAKPWIYVYFSSGAEGKEIDAPLPSVRTKAGHGLAYPVIELNGSMIKIDLFYRMLTPLELQRAMGFPDDMKWPDHCTVTEIVKAIGNSVSQGVARALGLAWYSQDSDVWSRVKDLYPKEGIHVES